MAFNFMKLIFPAEFAYGNCGMIDILYKNKYMKTLKKSSFLLLSGFLVSGSLWAQSADDIVSKYVDAIGGRKLGCGMNSIVIQRSVWGIGSAAPSPTHILNGKGVKKETKFQSTKEGNCITDKNGWGIKPLPA